MVDAAAVQHLFPLEQQIFWVFLDFKHTKKMKQQKKSVRGFFSLANCQLECLNNRKTLLAGWLADWPVVLLTRLLLVDENISTNTNLKLFVYIWLFGKGQWLNQFCCINLGKMRF